ncbi:sterile alpha motif domain-containing protein 11 isoform X2 [Rattus norvegicus]|uniref:sterile alpha motif domain-containing protein 11 isoform X2 n=1 Tax=Rattus norvegicus TaxID=10116 RepID=UPI0019171603|nr:sterile alpha motif domain-containing protein 11 isoform X3 [Rattus norvegicus]
MPAVKKELPGREDLALALATFHPTLASLPLPPLPAYLAPQPAAAALPSAASLPASASGYEALLAPSLCPPRAYLSLQEATPHLYLHRDPPAFQYFSASAAAAPDFQPLIDNGEPCIEVECGDNRALLYVRKLCQGSKGPSIRHRGEWLTPNEFQFVSGRETAKDWKRSIRHKGKSLKTLMSKGILRVHPPICDCPGCRISSPVNRGRLADKRTVTLPPTHALKKERTPSFSASDGDSDGSGPACGQQLSLKQEDDPHFHIMKRRVHTHWDVNISFRETSCSQDNDLPTLISSVHRSRCLVMPEHPRHCDFQRGNVEIGLGPGGDLLGKRLSCPYITSDCSSEKKARSKAPQETLLLPELESTMAPEDHYHQLMSALSEAGPFEETQRLYHLGIPSHAGHRRKQGLVQHREGTVPAATTSFSERELSQPPPLLPPQNAPHITMGSHLRPPFFGMPTALCQTPGYSFLPSAQAEMLARQQELLRKQSLARLEMSELLRQKELGSVHRPQLLAPEVALHIPEGPDELQRRGSMLVLKHGSAPLLALPPQGPPGPGPPIPAKESARSRSQKGSLGAASAQPSEPKETTRAGLWAQDVSEEPSKDSDGEDPEIAAARGGASTPSQVPAGGTRAEGKGLLSGSTLPPPLPLGFPCGAVSPYFHTGTMGGLFTDEETTGPEDINKWTVDDVCNFVGGLSGCGEYARVFREQGIDGETLPLLTEEHLLNTMGLKLGPALKIRAQVAKRLGRVFYMASFPVALPVQTPSLQAPVLSPGHQPLSPATTTSPYEGTHLPTGQASPKQENGSGTIALLPGAPDPSQLL